MVQKNSSDTLDILDTLAKKARARGVSDYSFTHFDRDPLSISVRNGSVEQIEGSREDSYEITVYFGQRSATALTNGHQNLERALETAVAQAKIVSSDKNTALTDPQDIATTFPDLDLNDPCSPSNEDLIEMARACEAAALSHPGVTNASGASAARNRTTFTMVASNGFRHQDTTSSHMVFAQVIAGKGGKMETDYASTQALWRSDLEDAELIGHLAAERATKRLNSIQMETGSKPVVFDPHVSGSLISAFMQAISGTAAYEKQTFLFNKMGKPVFRPEIQIVDDPLIVRGINSGSFDEEGIGRRRLELIKNGMLQTWMMGVGSARKLKQKSTGHASGPGNIYMAPGTLNPEDLVSDIKEGLYITGFLGGGSNPMTGDYSRGASGFLIKNGTITGQAISEITIAGNLRTIFADLIPANNIDLADFKHKSIIAPTIRSNVLMIGGK